MYRPVIAKRNLPRLRKLPTMALGSGSSRRRRDAPPHQRPSRPESGSPPRCGPSPIPSNAADRRKVEKPGPVAPWHLQPPRRLPSSIRNPLSPSRRRASPAGPAGEAAAVSRPRGDVRTTVSSPRPARPSQRFRVSGNGIPSRRWDPSANACAVRPDATRHVIRGARLRSRASNRPRAARPHPRDVCRPSRELSPPRQRASDLHLPHIRLPAQVLAHGSPHIRHMRSRASWRGSGSRPAGCSSASPITGASYAPTLRSAMYRTTAPAERTVPPAAIQRSCGDGSGGAACPVRQRRSMSRAMPASMFSRRRPMPLPDEPNSLPSMRNTGHRDRCRHGGVSMRGRGRAAGPMMGPIPEIHDASFKLWYDRPRMVEDL